jgi:hypothetical protein
VDESSRKNSFKMQTLDGAFDGQLSAALGKQAGLGIEAFSGTTLPFCSVGGRAGAVTAQSATTPV